MAEGAKQVVISDIDEAAMNRVAQELAQPARRCDVGNASAYADFLDWVERDIGPIDLRCNNPAIFGGREGGNFQTTEETWERSWQVNVLSHVRSAQQLVPRMLERGGGYFLQTVSAAGLITSNSALAYTVTKHAAIGFAEWLMLYYGDRGIRVSCLCPTAVETWPGQFEGMDIGLVQTDRGTIASRHREARGADAAIHGRSDPSSGETRSGSAVVAAMTIRGNHLYDHLGVRSKRIDDESGGNPDAGQQRRAGSGRTAGGSARPGLRARRRFIPLRQGHGSAIANLVAHPG